MTDAATAARWLQAASQRLAAAGVSDPQREARLLLRWATGHESALPLDDVPVLSHVAAKADRALERRAARVPLSHILGRRAFWAHDFTVSSAVLDPRPDTETLVAAALELPAPRLILDAGVGSGCILLSLLAAWPEARGIGLDFSGSALAVARQNAEVLGVGGRVLWVRGNWLAAIGGPIDMVVSNPPYLTRDEMEDIAPELRHEPALALDGGNDGLDAYRALVRRLPDVLVPGGRALLEIGSTQAESVSTLLAQSGLQNPTIHVDINGRARVVSTSAPKIGKFGCFSG